MQHWHHSQATCAKNKTENPFSLKDDERDMTRKKKPMSTRKLTNPHNNFGTATKGLWHTLIAILTIFDNNFDNPYTIITISKISLTIPNDNFDNSHWQFWQLPNSNNNYQRILSLKSWNGGKTKTTTTTTTTTRQNVILRDNEQ